MHSSISGVSVTLVVDVEVDDLVVVVVLVVLASALNLTAEEFRLRRPNKINSG